VRAETGRACRRPRGSARGRRTDQLFSWQWRRKVTKEGKRSGSLYAGACFGRCYIKGGEMRGSATVETLSGGDPRRVSTPRRFGETSLNCPPALHQRPAPPPWSTAWRWRTNASPGREEPHGQDKVRQAIEHGFATWRAR